MPTFSEAEHEAMLARYSEVQDRFRRRRRLPDRAQGRDGAARPRLRARRRRSSSPITCRADGRCAWRSPSCCSRAPDLLLLDEPTNHLDLDARNWLEEYLVAYPHSVILVSHDRYFLDAVVTHIADLTLRKITEYHTNYTKYLEQRDAALERLRDAKRRQDEEIQRVEEFINRFRYQATKAAQVQSRIKMLDKVERLEVPPERKRIHFQFPAAPKSGRMVLELKGARKAYGAGAEESCSTSVDLHIERGDRIALVGHNGAGKSTLMRMLSGEEAPDAGTRTEGHQVVMQYFAQDEATRLESGADGLRNARRPARRTRWCRRSATSSAASCSRATTSTRRRACCRAANARASPSRACCCGRRTRCCSTSRPTTSTSTRRKCCSTRSPITAAR